jgi:hypothetical protein
LLTSCSTPRRIRTFAGGGHSLDFIKAFECRGGSAETAPDSTGAEMRDLDLEPENEEYKALEATANLAQDPDDAAIDRAIELEIGHLPDDEREPLRDKVRGRLNRQ